MPIVMAQAGNTALRRVVGTLQDLVGKYLDSCWGEAGANFLIFRTHWSGMPVGQALASMRLIGDELLPELQRIKPPSD